MQTPTASLWLWRVEGGQCSLGAAGGLGFCAQCLLFEVRICVFSPNTK